MRHVWSYILMIADERLVTLLGQPDLSAAFDCTDHSMLLDRLRFAVVLSDSVLDLVRSFLTDRTQQIAYSGQLSAVQPVLFGVLQRSVLGPLSYLLYTAELALVVTRHGLNLHQCANDMQVNVSTSASNAEAAVARLTACLVDIEAWLKASRLRLNPTKTQVMWFGSPAADQSQHLTSAIGVDTYQWRWHMTLESSLTVTVNDAVYRCLHRWPLCV